MDFENLQAPNSDLAKLIFMQHNWKQELEFEGKHESSEPSVPLSSYCELQTHISRLSEDFKSQKLEAKANLQINQSALKILKSALEKYKNHIEKLNKSNESKMKKLLVYKHFISEYCKNLEITEIDVDLDSELKKIKDLRLEQQELSIFLENSELKNHFEEEKRGYQSKIKDLVGMLKSEKEKTKKASETAKKAIDYMKTQKPDTIFKKKLEDLSKLYKILSSENEKLRRSQGIKLSTSEILSKISEIKSELSSTKSYISTVCQKLPLLLIKLVRESLSNHFSNKSSSDLSSKCEKLIQENKILLNTIHQLKGNIRVFCRVRPVLDFSNKTCVEVIENKISVQNPILKSTKIWDFDRIFGPQTTQDAVYSEIKDLISSSLNGYNVCIFTYGQTGSGKTFTLEGPEDDPGIISKTSADLFAQIRNRPAWDFKVKISLLEVYNESINDLLSEKQEKLKVVQNEVAGLTKITVKNVDELIGYMKYGLAYRATRSNKLNLHSSRSHLVMTLYILGTNSAKVKFTSKVQLVDLAGSERLNKTNSKGEALAEAKHINLSLHTLGSVIAARFQKLSYVPFRNSVLTQVLQDSLSGEAKTLMVLQISPEESNYEETICSLNFATNAKNTSLGCAKSSVVKDN